MSSHLRLLAFAALLCGVFVAGCGENGEGCSAPPEKKESGGGGAGGGGSLGGGGSGPEIALGDRRGKVPKPYQRPEATAQSKAPEPEPQPKTEPAPEPPKAAAPAPRRALLPAGRVTKRALNGIKDRVEVSCRVMAKGSDADCLTAKNIAEIKDRCCPNGKIESCRSSMSGVVLVGVGCE